MKDLGFLLLVVLIGVAIALVPAIMTQLLYFAIQEGFLPWVILARITAGWVATASVMLFFSVMT